jgi:hypothetical protein
MLRQVFHRNVNLHDTHSHFITHFVLHLNTVVVTVGPKTPIQSI